MLGQEAADGAEGADLERNEEVSWAAAASEGGHTSHRDHHGSDRHNNHGDRHNNHGDRHNSHGDRHNSHGDRHSTYGDRHNSHGDRHNSYGDRHSSQTDRHNSHAERPSTLFDRQNSGNEKNRYSEGSISSHGQAHDNDDAENRTDRLGRGTGVTGKTAPGMPPSSASGQTMGRPGPTQTSQRERRDRNTSEENKENKENKDNKENLDKSKMSLTGEGESDSDHSSPQHQTNKSSQKKFVKNFKQLPSEEIVLQRYSCALVGDILLQGHLYVTENYFAFHSNVFGYVTRIQIPIVSVTKITKEKTAKIIPNAVGVCTEEEKHVFVSLISRDATFKVMTKVWKKALALSKTDLTIADEIVGNGVLGDEEDEDEEDGVMEDDSSDSIDPLRVRGDALTLPPKGLDSPYLLKRMSGTSGALFYQTRTVTPLKQPPSPGEGIPVGKNPIHRFIISVLTVPGSSLLLLGLGLLLLLLLCTSLYLVFRLDGIQQRVESAMPAHPAHPQEGMEQIASWQSMLQQTSTKKIQEFLNKNLDQITKVRESLQKLSLVLNSHGETKEKDEH